MPKTRLLFFFKDDLMCKRFYQTYVKKYVNFVYRVDLTTPSPESVKITKDFSVQSIPCLILLDIDGYEIERWQGGKMPDMHLINIEVGIGSEMERINNHAR